MQIKFLRFIDRTLIAAVLFVCCLPSLLRRSSRSGLPAEPQSILLIRVWGLGSSLIGFSLARELRQRFPDARLDLLASTRNISVFRHQDYFARAYNLFAPADLLAMLRR